jgi:hypothetical protein
MIMRQNRFPQIYAQGDLTDAHFRSRLQNRDKFLAIFRSGYSGYKIIR